jgi:hypothetical protein
MTAEATELTVIFSCIATRLAAAGIVRHFMETAIPPRTD